MLILPNPDSFQPESTRSYDHPSYRRLIAVAVLLISAFPLIALPKKWHFYYHVPAYRAQQKWHYSSRSRLSYSTKVALHTFPLIVLNKSGITRVPAIRAQQKWQFIRCKKLYRAYLYSTLRYPMLLF